MDADLGGATLAGFALGRRVAREGVALGQGGPEEPDTDGTLKGQLHPRRDVAIGDTYCIRYDTADVMIRSFHDRMIEAVFRGRCPKGFPADLFKAARRRLVTLDGATSLDDPIIPTSNRLHPLERDRAGQHAIAVNAQFRICFVWTEAEPERVEFADYL